MNLSFRQLQTFREVMRTGSISEASRNLGRTQPAVSTMIAGLERELRYPLFLREHGRLTPRPEAHYFLEEAEAVLDRLAQSARVMDEIGKLDHGRLRIACHPAASGFFMPRVLAGFLDGRPGVEAALMMRSSAVVEDLVASQEYDIGLAETPAPRASIRTEDFALPCLLALPADSPLATRDSIGPTDLDGHPMATLFDAHHTWQATRAAFDQAGARLNRRFVLQTFLPALELVAAGLCCTLSDRITAASHTGARVVFRPFTPNIISSVSILTPAHRPPSLLAQGFRDNLRQALTRLTTEPAQNAAKPDR